MKMRFSTFRSKWVLPVSLALLSGLSLLGTTAQAFSPKNTTKGVAFLVGRTHQSITEAAILAIDKEYFSVKDLTKSMRKARNEIVENNANVDKDQFNSFKHFDGESFAKGQERVTNLRAMVVTSLMKENVTGARFQLGEALHTMQDFYSHSNWVELGNTDINPDLGVPGQPIHNVAGPTDVVCDAKGNLLTTTTKLTSGYFADFKLVYDPLLMGLVPVPVPEDGANQEALMFLNGKQIKCRHGGVEDFSPGSGGINKDTYTFVLSPHSTKAMHNQAADLATKASEEFIRGIYQDLQKKESKEIALKHLGLLLGHGPSLAIAIDTTGSMSDIQESVKAQAIAIVEGRLGTDDEPSQYVLAPFNDPNVPAPFVTTDADKFEAAINSLTADGGGDLPELSQTGMLGALSVMDAGGDLFMFTDADAKDSDLADSVTALAEKNNILLYPTEFSTGFSGASFSAKAASAKSDPFANDKIKAMNAQQALKRSLAPAIGMFDISFVDPTYINEALASGGQAFGLQRSEAGALTQVAGLLTHANTVRLLSIDDFSTATKTYSVPVDSAMTSVTFLVNGTTTVTVLRPDNSSVQPTDAGVSYVPLSSGVAYSIANPSPGKWHVSVSGNGAFSVSVSGESTLDLASFNYVALGGRAGHEAYYPIAGLPAAGKPSTVDAILTDGFKTAHFDFRSAAGATLQSLPLSAGTGATADEFLGTVTPPSVPFRVYVSGQDTSGKDYQRVLPAVTSLQTVTITAPVSQDLKPNQTTSYVFHVTNLGSSDGFDFTAADDHGLVSATNPASFSLGTGASADVTVELTTPFLTFGGTDTLTATVKSSGSGANNYAVVNSSIVQSPEVTSQIRAAVSGLVYVRSTGAYAGRITLTNIGSAKITGPLYLVFYNLTSGVSLVNASGSVSGVPYFTGPASLLPGASVTLPVQFNNPGTTPVSYTPRVFL